MASKWAKGRQAPKTTAASSTPAVFRASIPAWLGDGWEMGVSSDMMISSEDDGEMMGASWRYNLQDLGVLSQEPIYHPTCIGSFERGETNTKQCLRVPPMA